VHAGAIYSACWKADSTQIMTVSADKTCKVIDASTLEEVCSFTLGTKTEDQQVGCAFLAEQMISYSLGGQMQVGADASWACACACACACARDADARGVGCAGARGVHVHVHVHVHVYVHV